MITPMSSAGARGLAAFLGLRNADRFTELALVDKIAAGLPPLTAETVARRIDPTGLVLQATDLIPKATYHRKLKDKAALSSDHSARLFGVARVFSEALRQYHGDDRAAREFLVGPHPLLDGRSALSVALGSTAGAELVMTLLARADAGVAV